MSNAWNALLVDEWLDQCKDKLVEYKSHKIVKAMQILSISFVGTHIVVFFVNQELPTLELTYKDIEHKPVPQQYWFFVVYDDGYFSFSPDEAFSKGHERVRNDLKQV